MQAHTLERVLGLRQKPDRERGTRNMVMHVGQAILLGAWRGVMAEGGLREPRASGMFTVIRLANDQRLENVTGQGAPPWTWSPDELIVHVLHKGVYAFVTGAIADALAEHPPAWIEACSGVRQRQRSIAGRKTSCWSSSRWGATPEAGRRGPTGGATRQLVQSPPRPNPSRSPVATATCGQTRRAAAPGEAAMTRPS
jgi:hypothetical protein